MNQQLRDAIKEARLALILVVGLKDGCLPGEAVGDLPEDQMDDLIEVCRTAGDELLKAQLADEAQNN